MERRTKILIVQLSFASLVIGFTAGQMVQRKASGVARSQFDRCIAVTEQCIGYLTECRSEARP